MRLSSASCVTPQLLASRAEGISILNFLPFEDLEERSRELLPGLLSNLEGASAGYVFACAPDER
jgi:hypothetical protein